MVSKAREVLPEPDTPVMTIILFLGSSRSMFFRLFSLAPLIMILFFIYVSFCLFYFIFSYWLFSSILNYTGNCFFLLVVIFNL